MLKRFYIILKWLAICKLQVFFPLLVTIFTMTVCCSFDIVGNIISNVGMYLYNCLCIFLYCFFVGTFRVCPTGYSSCAKGTPLCDVSFYFLAFFVLRLLLLFALFSLLKSLLSSLRLDLLFLDCFLK